MSERKNPNDRDKIDIGSTLIVFGLNQSPPKPLFSSFHKSADKSGVSQGCYSIMHITVLPRVDMALWLKSIFIEAQMITLV